MTQEQMQEQIIDFAVAASEIVENQNLKSKSRIKIEKLTTIARRHK